MVKFRRDSRVSGSDQRYDKKLDKKRYDTTDKRVKETYFTGMFTSEQTDFYVPYVDPESNRLRKYYPDFLVEMDGWNLYDS